MNLPEVEIILTNWKRKNNLPILIGTMREQSVPVTITLIDNAHKDTEAVDTWVINKVDKYFRIKNNPYGPFIRFACHGFYDAEYLFVYDDDMIPGKECVSHFLNHAKANPQYGLLGQFGRIFEGDQYNFNKVKRLESFVPVDICICAYFLHRSILPSIDEVKCRIIFNDWTQLFIEDDMILAASCRLAEKEIMLTPDNPDKETFVKKQGLPQPFPLSSMSHRPQRRTEALQLIRSIVPSWNNYKAIDHQIKR
jgi:hypothetical protein